MLPTSGRRQDLCGLPAGPPLAAARIASPHALEHPVFPHGSYPSLQKFISSLFLPFLPNAENLSFPSSSAANVNLPSVF